MAKKSDAAMYGVLVALTLIALPFVWLFQAVGRGWFIAIVVGVPVLGLAAYVIRGQRQAARRRVKAREFHEQERQLAAKGWVIGDNYSLRLLHDIEHVYAPVDINQAREMLQRIAYWIIRDGIPQEQKDHFKAFMARFAGIDPLYHRVLEKALPAIRSNPGIMQSALYKGRPADEKELIRYVLYFAHELGHIYRRKKGNSYQLFPSQEAADAVASK